MNPLHLMWICPLCVIAGIFLTAICAGSYDSEKTLEAKKADENPEPIPTGIDIDYYLEGRRPSGLIEED